MKRLLGLLSLFVTFCGNEAGAQDRVVDRMSDRGTPGLIKMGDTRFYYTYYYQDEKGGPKGKARVIAEMFNDSLVTTQRIELTLDKSVEIAHLSPMPDRQLLLITVDPAKGTRTTAFINALGEVLKSKEEEGLAKEELGPEAYPHVFVPSPEDMIIVFPVNSRSGGYRIRSVNKEFEENWAQLYTPKTGNWKIERIAQVGPTLLIVQRETASEGQISYSIKGIEQGGGNIAFNIPLTDGNQNLLYPTFITSDMGTISIGGSVFNAGRTDVKQPDGMFSMQLSLMGDVQGQTRIAWDDVKASGDNSILPLFDSKSIILPRAAYFAPPETHVIIAEVLLPSAGNAQPYSAQSTDLVAFFTDREGKFQHATRIKKSASDIASASPVVAASDAIRLLDSTASLSYQGKVMGPDGSVYIAYTDKVKDTTRLMLHPLDAGATEMINSLPIYFASPAKGGNKSEKIKPARVFIEPQGKVIFYGYNGPRIHMASRTIGMKTSTRRAGDRPPPPPRVPEPPQPLPETHKNANK